MANYINVLQQRARSAGEYISGIETRVREFRHHLSGSKFQGHDHRDGQPNDYIRTGDVNRWLDYVMDGGERP